MSHRAPLTALAVLAAAAIAGCGSQTSNTQQPTSRLLTVPGSSVGKIVLTPLGAQRLDLQTVSARTVLVPVPVPAPAPTPASQATATQTTPAAPAKPAPPARPATRASGLVTVPTSAIVYDSTGRTLVFTRQGPLTFAEHAVNVDHISGNDDLPARRSARRHGCRLARRRGTVRDRVRGPRADMSGPVSA